MSSKNKRGGGGIPLVWALYTILILVMLLIMSARMNQDRDRIRSIEQRLDQHDGSTIDRRRAKSQLALIEGEV